MRYFLAILFLIQGYASAVTIEQYNTWDAIAVYTGGITKIGQTFTIGTTGPSLDFYLESLSLAFTRTNNEVVTIQIFATSGGLPTGPALSTGTIPADGGSLYRTVSMPSVLLNSGVKYACVISYAGGGNITIKNTGTYSGGSEIYFNGSSWNTNSQDLNFTISGSTTITGGTISSPQTICYNSDVAAFSNLASASLGAGSYIYTWEYSTTSSIAGQGTWTVIPSSNSTTYNPGSISQTTYYVRIVGDGYSIAYSNVVTVTVRGQVTGGGISPGQNICYNTDVAPFVNNANPSGGMGNYTYVWQYSTTSSIAGQGEWANISYNSATYDPGALTTTTYYTRKATDACGIGYSNVLTINVWPELSGGIISGSQSLCSGYDVPAFTSTSSATGAVGPITYLWLYSTTSSDPLTGSWTSTGATIETYDPGVLTATRYYVRRATNATCGVVYSNVLTVTVTSQITPGTISASQTICYNTDVAALTNTSSASGGTYTWQYSTTSSTAGLGAWTNIPSSNTPTYDPGSIPITTYYTRRSSNGVCPSVYTNVVTATVRDPFVEGQVGSNQTVSSGANVAAFTSISPASGGSGSYTYTWQYSTSTSVGGAGTWTDISSSNSATYDYGTITETTYFVRKVVDASCGTRYSNVITVTVSAGGGTPCSIFRLNFENNGVDGSGNHFQGHHVGDSLYTTTHVNGTHAWLPGYADGWESKAAYNIGTTWSLKLDFEYTTSSNWHIIFSNMTNPYSSAGTYIAMDAGLGLLRGQTRDASGNVDEWIGPSLSISTMYDLVIEYIGTHVRVYVNGTKQSLADSIIQNDYATNAIISLGDAVGHAGTYGWNQDAYFDNVHFYDHELAGYEVTGLLNNRTSTSYEACTSGTPHTAKGEKHLNKVIYFTNYYAKEPLPEAEEPPPQPAGLVRLFSETFESTPVGYFLRDTIIRRFQPTINWWGEDNTIVNAAAPHNHVWQSMIRTGQHDSDNGFSFQSSFNDTVDAKIPVYFSRDLYADPGYNGTASTNYYSGKIMQGLSGGKGELQNGPFVLDSTAGPQGNGWSLHGVWGSSSNPGVQPNGMRPYWYDQAGAGNQINPFYRDAAQTEYQNVPNGYWVKLTYCVKMNDRGKSNGWIEVYVDNVLTNVKTGIKWISLPQWNAKMNRISGLGMRFFFGGGGVNYASPRNNFIQIDNLDCYYYEPGNSEFHSSPYPLGHVLPTVSLPSPNVYSSPVLYDENFTSSSGTIKSHYTGAYYPPNMRQGTVQTKTITSHSNPIHLQFSGWDVESNGWDLTGTGGDSWIKIYSGTGTGKSLLYTYNEQNTPPGGVITISATSCTIEFYSGWDYNHGYKINFY